ncbi:MAG: hypothetical protein J6P60_02570, partial [Lachnospiraceae bacterium]|nr:hypothetical protein [Lachnospiraceae bacterium]
MKPKKLFRNLYDQKRDIQDRLFILLSGVALVALLATILLGIMIGESKEDIMVLLVSWVAFFLLTYLSVKFSRVQLGANLIAVVII